MLSLPLLPTFSDIQNLLPSLLPDAEVQSLLQSIGSAVDTATNTLSGIKLVISKGVLDFNIRYQNALTTLQPLVSNQPQLQQTIMSVKNYANTITNNATANLNVESVQQLLQGGSTNISNTISQPIPTVKDVNTVIYSIEEKQAHFSDVTRIAEVFASNVLAAADTNDTLPLVAEHLSNKLIDNTNSAVLKPIKTLGYSFPSVSQVLTNTDVLNTEQETNNHFRQLISKVFAKEETNATQGQDSVQSKSYMQGTISPIIEQITIHQSGATADSVDIRKTIENTLLEIFKN